MSEFWRYFSTVDTVLWVWIAAVLFIIIAGYVIVLFSDRDTEHRAKNTKSTLPRPLDPPLK